MKKSVSKAVAFCVAVIMIIVSVTPAYAFFSTNSLLTNSMNGNNWMSGIKDNTSLSDISIPGTHDSGTKLVDGIYGAWATTQPLTITEQLNIGIRYFDLRLEHTTDVNYNARIVHGSITCYNEQGGYLTLYEVLEDMYSFLASNPSETVIVSVKQDAGDDINALANDVNTLINLKSNYWYTGTNTPKLGDVRGKCVLASRITQVGRGIALNWSDQGSDGEAVDTGSIKVQDRYNMGTSKKWYNAAKPMLDETKPDGKWYVNFFSTTGAGISGVATCSNAMNSFFKMYEMISNKCYGLICFDYADEDLAKKVYKCNDLAAKNQPSADEGQYYYRINFNTTDDVDAGWREVQVRLYYRENNGTGDEKSILIFDNSDTYNGYYFVCNTGNFDYSGYLDGFPTRLEFKYNWQNGEDGLSINQRLYVSRSPNDSMVLCCKNDFVKKSFIGSDAVGDEFYYTSSDLYPYAKTIDFELSGELTVSAPEVTSSAVNKYTLLCDVYDQYGVKWYLGPTAYSTSANYDGVSQSNGVISLNSRANNLNKGTSFYLYANYTDSKSNITAQKNIIINTNKITYSYVNENGDILQTGSDYAGTIPVYNGAVPTKDPDENGHYTFSSWTQSGTLSTTNNVYTATYSSNQHLVAATIETVKPTCTHDGYNTNYCSCGYSWTVPTSATGHNIVTETKPATCTEDGYTRQICKVCGYIESQTDYQATGHDIDNAYKGEYVSASENGNAYTPYFCPTCNMEIEELRQYDTIDWSKYYDALKMFGDIQSSAEYAGYDASYVSELEAAVSNAQSIESDEQSSVLQVSIDKATKEITDAVDAFSENVGVKYYTLTFIFADGSYEKQTYKDGTALEEINVPDNTATLMSASQHTIYKWPTVKEVTKDFTYNENSAVSNHTYDTFIFPNVSYDPTCTQDGYTVYTCICGYSYSVKTADSIGHDFEAWQSNGDGTHTRVCSNDKTHVETQNCIINTSNHKCIVCEYEIDMSAFNAVMEVAQADVLYTAKYTAESIAVLEQEISNAQTGVAQADTQSKVDILTAQLQDAVSKLEINSYSISFCYVIDDEYSIKVDSCCGTYAYGDTVELSVPQEVMSNSAVEKWTAEYLTDNYIKKLSASNSTLTAVVEGNVEYIAYISTDKNVESDIRSKISILDNNARVTDILYLENGTYNVTVSGNTITFSMDNKEYSLVAKDCVFYNITSYTVNDAELEGTMTIDSNVTIKPVYSV